MLHRELGRLAVEIAADDNFGGWFSSSDHRYGVLQLLDEPIHLVEN